MQSKVTRLLSVDSVEQRTFKPIVKLLLVVGALFLVWGLVTNLPGIDALVPETAVTVGAVFGAVLTVAIVAVLGYVAFTVEPLIKQALAGPSSVVKDVASIAKYLVLFVAVITAHSGLAPLVVPALAVVDLVWTYDMLFLLLALVPTAMIVVHMWGNFDEVATLLTSRVVTEESEGDRQATEDGSTP